MVTILRKHATSEGNKLEFYTTDYLGANALVVRDESCQMERTYRIGTTNELELCEEPELIISFEQVIHAWTSEQVRF